MTEQDFIKLIQDGLIEMDGLYVDTFEKQPYSSFSFSGTTEGFSMWAWGENIDDRIAFNGKAIFEVLDAGREYFKALPPAKDRNLSSYQKSVAALIDKGRELGIDGEYVAPLADVFKAISTNLLTHQPEATP